MSEKGTVLKPGEVMTFTYMGIVMTSGDHPKADPDTYLRAQLLAFGCATTEKKGEYG